MDADFSFIAFKNIGRMSSFSDSGIYRQSQFQLLCEKHKSKRKKNQATCQSKQDEKPDLSFLIHTETAMFDFLLEKLDDDDDNDDDFLFLFYHYYFYLLLEKSCVFDKKSRLFFLFNSTLHLLHSFSPQHYLFIYLTLSFSGLYEYTVSASFFI